MRREKKKVSENKWKKIGLGILAAVLLPALPAAAQQIDLDSTDGSITLSPMQYIDDQTGEMVLLNGGTASIYLVSELLWTDGNWQYDSATGVFADVSGLEDLMNRMDTENAAIANMLASDTEGRQGTTNPISEGSVSFTGLTPGLYLIAQPTRSADDAGFSPFLVSIPTQIDGELVYQITSLPKTMVGRTISGNQETETETETEETEPGTEAETKPTLSGEKSDPPNSNRTPSSEGSSGSGERTGNGGRLPQTGQLWWPVPVLALAGLLLVVIGRILRRRSE